MITLKKGSSGNIVKAIQYFLEIDPDGKFGNITKEKVTEFQKKKGLIADGIIGAATYTAIISEFPTVRIGSTGKYVYMIESILETMKLDGKFTNGEESSVKAFQAANGLSIDGIVGKNTLSALFGMCDSSVVPKDDHDKKKPVDYKQYDSRWGKKIYSTHNDPKQTYSASACGPTSMADIIATVCDPSVTPPDMGALAISLGDRSWDNGTNWTFFKHVFERYSQFKKFVQTKSFETMRSCLNTGGYVVVSFGPGSKSKWTKGGHFCCLWKDDGKYIYVNDPASASSSRAKGTYAEVQDAAKQYFCFW